MSHLLSGVSDDFQEECHFAMINGKMNISHLMVYASKMEEAKAMRKNRDAKSARYFDGGSTKNRLEIQDKPIFKKRFSNQVPSKFPKARDDKVPNPRDQKESSGNSPNKKPTCAKCRKGHFGECMVGTGNFFVCGKSGHKVRDCPKLKGQEKGG